MKKDTKSYSKILSEEECCDDILSSFFENVEDISKGL